MPTPPKPARWPKRCSRPAWSTASISAATSSRSRPRRPSNGSSWSPTSCRSCSTISCSTRRCSSRARAAGIEVAPDGAPSFEEDPADADIIDQIKELLETRVRPAVAQDGGDIVYRGYQGRQALPRHAGRLLRLPLVDGHAEARRRKPDQALCPRGRDHRSRLTSFAFSLPPTTRLCLHVGVATGGRAADPRARHFDRRLHRRAARCPTAPSSHRATR